MTLKEIAQAIHENSQAVADRRISWEEFGKRNRALWALADRGEECIIGSPCDRRCTKVHEYLSQIPYAA